jgi:2-iminobutanoate/2-iminopropanoate deaminase
MTREVVATENAPAAVGPYSQGIISGNLIFTAGQAALDPQTGKLVEGGIHAETHQVFKNLIAVLEEAGSSLEHVVKVSVFLMDMNDFAAMNEVYAQYFGDNPPARTTVQAAGLPVGAQVEIDMIAVRP